MFFNCLLRSRKLICLEMETETEIFKPPNIRIYRSMGLYLSMDRCNLFSAPRNYIKDFVRFQSSPFNDAELKGILLYFIVRSIKMPCFYDLQRKFWIYGVSTTNKVWTNNFEIMEKNNHGIMFLNNNNFWNSFLSI